ncbi:phage integrase family protein [Tahibacter aquaticus]|uniref:Phage integrase family protein n=1 Tax=Tahibacter aquaticus TaxID=520092 RepID=A0A4R6YPD6_9GAMM|nr:gamma-mobile-trio recombinase GmtY [Tahibacter aquaticus]TDR39637.1 phage integrase family protein [Tahibacter aquaticus]
MPILCTTLPACLPATETRPDSAAESGRSHYVRHEDAPSPLEPQRSRYVLWTWQEGGKPERFEPLLRYFEHLGRSCSLERQRRIAAMVGLLWDFGLAHARSGSAESIWTAFPEALVGGTEHLEGSLAELRWPPASPRSVHARLAVLDGFLRWLADTTGSRPTAVQWLDRAVAARRAAHRAKHAAVPFSTASAVAHERGRAFSASRRRPATEADAVAFDESKIEELLTVGFRRRGARPEDGDLGLNLRDVLYTILLHGGGLRSCEPLHIFTDDVGVDPTDPDCAEVRLYHPEVGRAPAKAQGSRRGRGAVQREEFLREWYRRAPRTLAAPGQRAGWKNLRLDRPAEGYSAVRWFPKEWGRVFLRLFNLYRAERPDDKGRHPFLFVSEHGPERGMPYTLQSYRQAHALAVRRIGLTVAKALGTTPHAHRHAYGRRLAAAGAPRGAVQVALHHVSPESQGVYTQPSLQQVADDLTAAEQRGVLRGNGAVLKKLGRGST